MLKINTSIPKIFSLFQFLSLVSREFKKNSRFLSTDWDECAFNNAFSVRFSPNSISTTASTEKIIKLIAIITVGFSTTQNSSYFLQTTQKIKLVKLSKFLKINKLQMGTIYREDTVDLSNKSFIEKFYCRIE